MAPTGELVENVLTTIFDFVATGSERTESHFSGDWLSISTLGLSHRRSYFRVDGETYGRQYNRREPWHRPVDYSDIDFPQLNDLYFVFRNKVRLSSGNSNKYIRYTDRRSKNGVYSFGAGEFWWQAVGGSILSREGYIVFNEGLSSRWSPGHPDLTCFKLGEIQRVLADIGVVPGGATLPEIELRSKYDKLDSHQVKPETTTGVVEVKDIDKATSGIRQLRSHRGGRDRKPPYLESDQIEEGWLVCPEARSSLEPTDTVGGVTWDADTVSVIPPTSTEAPKKAKALQEARAITLQSVLQFRDLDEELPDAISRCLDDPTVLYEYFHK